MVEEAYDLVAQAYKWPEKDKVEFQTGFPKATGQCRQIFTNMKRFYHYGYDLNPSICKETPEELRFMLSSGRYNIFDIKPNTAGKWNSQRHYRAPASTTVD